MYYAKAQFYDPAAKRFVSMDPVKGNVTDPLSLVSYLYCVDNPLRYVDPLGELPTFGEIRDGIKSATRTVVNATKTITIGAAKATVEVGKVVTKTVVTVGSAASKTVESAGSIVANVVEKISPSTADNIRTSTRSTANSIANTTANLAIKSANTTVSVAKTITSAGTSLIKAEAAVGKKAIEVVNIAEGVTQQAKVALDLAKKGTTNIAEGVQNGGSAWGSYAFKSSLINFAGPFAPILQNKAREKRNEQLASANSQIKFGWDQFKQAGQELWDITKYFDKQECPEDIQPDKIVGVAGERKTSPAEGTPIDFTKPYAHSRPSFRKGVVEEVWRQALIRGGGVVRDPNTRDIIEWTPGTPRAGVWDMGHISKAKYSEVHARYMRGEMTTEEFVDWYNNPKNYRPELPHNNRGHYYE